MDCKWHYGSELSTIVQGLAGVMRLQLAFPEAHFLSNDKYNQFFTMHGSTMMFLFAVPSNRTYRIQRFTLRQLFYTWYRTLSVVSRF